MADESKTPEFGTPRQAAQRTQMPERLIRRLIAEGKIPVVRSGARQYISISALLQMLNDGVGAIWE